MRSREPNRIQMQFSTSTIKRQEVLLQRLQGLTALAKAL
jgi:hypothetical protein